MADRFVVKRLVREDEALEAFCCMSEVPTPWPETLHMCRVWASQNLGQYIEGYHVQAPDGVAVGQLYYAPSERALVAYSIEPNVAVMYCEWVQQRHQKRGLGRLLFDTFESEMREQGYKGILVEATDREQQMYYGHYLARGFELIHQADHRRLLYLPLDQPQIEVQPLQSRIQPRTGTPVEVLILTGYLCPFETTTQLLLEQVAGEFGDRVVIRQEPLSPHTLQQYGVADGIYINGRPRFSGGVTEEVIRQAILEELEI